MTNPEVELCCLCDEPTGKSGKGEDSIYRILAIDWCFDGCMDEMGDEIGPLCEECNHKLEDKEVLEPLPENKD